MSVTESKAVSKASKSTRRPKKAAVTEAVEQALANAPVEMVPVRQLVHIGQNVRKHKPDPEKLQELAASILSVGVLQNLVVCPMPDGMLGVAAGGRRLSALHLLLGAGSLTADYPVPVKIVEHGMAMYVSETENSKRENMHPADQIAAFAKMSETGDTAAQIGSVLGYTTKHVHKCLRLAGMAPALLAELAEDSINLDQLQALSATEDHERQLDVWKNAYGIYRTPRELRDAAVMKEVAAEGNSCLMFVGRDAYEQAGGGFTVDLFTDEGFIRDTVLLATLTREKLTGIAESVAQAEGWSWALGRPDGISTYGEDAENYLLLKQPEPVMTGEEQARVDALYKQLGELSERSEQDQADFEAMDYAEAKCQAEIKEIEGDAAIRAWSDDVRAKAGVVVSLSRGELSVRRGVMKRCDLPEIVGDTDKTGVNQHLSSIRTEDIDAAQEKKSLSAVLVKSLSSERTLAVQAALAEQPDKALVMFVHDCLTSTFDHHGRYVPKNFTVTLHPKTSQMLANAPTSEDSLAMQHLNAIHASWQAILPEGWHDSWKWLLSWNTQTLIDAMSYCLARTLDGASERLSHKTGKAGERLEPVEAVLGFTLRDWWLPTKANFFGRIGKEQISDSLSQAGLEGASRDALKMKKAEAAGLAEDKIVLTSWVPDCLLPVADEVAPPQESDAFTETDAAASDTETQSTHIAA
ncbi:MULTISPECIES: ParB/RepB/Spo0J family partition protein [Rahnella]|uniref:ParB/RepB/Spo0J family partition protein n=1 Tax=Rahnella laticis TaxID=2787622 RepID=A0ABS0EAQ0_9GAMM|nr:MULTISPECIES: ParB/RepB/Spo0J family partition protein [Rahnella]MBF7982077.1 ParB/RepB/Spo0J family partition protein [Rahnella laticis]MBF8002167.1 ParB/RepB/Spo0J family partition protein [Rahnella sp. LAC-M12]